MRSEQKLASFLMVALCGAFVPSGNASAEDRLPAGREKQVRPSNHAIELDRRLAALEAEMEAGLTEVDRTISRLERSDDKDALARAREIRVRLLAQLAETQTMRREIDR